MNGRKTELKSTGSIRSEVLNEHVSKALDRQGATAILFELTARGSKNLNKQVSRIILCANARKATFYYYKKGEDRIKIIEPSKN